MSFAAIGTALRGFVESTLAPTIPGWAVRQPNLTSQALDAATKRAAVELHFTSAKHAGFGSGVMVQRNGTLDLVLSVPIESGEGDLFEAADALRLAGSEVTSGGVRFQRANFRPAQETAERWTQRVALPWVWRGTSSINPDFTSVASGGYASGAASIRTAIQSRVETLLPVQVTYGNQGAEGEVLDTSNPIVFLDILFGNDTSRDLGEDATGEIVGLVQASIYTPAGSGDGLSLEIADAFNTALMARQIGAVECGFPNIESQLLDGPWWVTSLVAALSVTHQQS